MTPIELSRNEGEECISSSPFSSFLIDYIEEETIFSVTFPRTLLVIHFLDEHQATKMCYTLCIQDMNEWV